MGGVSVDFLLAQRVDKLERENETMRAAILDALYDFDAGTFGDDAGYLKLKAVAVSLGIISEDWPA